ncbi:MAG: bifunctional DNA-formamidopyrimidine glycosylase/DNA-(apurinic or apyrimidinic site) lyase [Bryobacteraceae bacterium]|nr:bifunctional DNA-formamidopyrimidine glycosylase/DNA-(apurinic or apyrimidinic site) lyase [Bryobacteraceae bacterium]MCX7604146.1 bifunctional DNA-formamidopyrimidine glycosylase/DNA-(apurinic or apyrimidinic site) lyase [Bryobacteraceae bacterium]
MPELPEVECIVRSLRPRLEGLRLKHVELRSAIVASPDSAKAIARLSGGCVRSLGRRGKFLLLHMESGCCAIHLRMTGRLIWEGDTGPYTRAVFHFDSGRLVLDDPRQFARIEAGAALPESVLRLGPEPFDLSPEEFAARLRARRGRIKPLLLDQRFLAGLGNIYADEALHRARIHPLARAGRIARSRAASLHAAILSLLEEAIAAGGSSISDYVDGTGARGAFQQQHRVYGREGQPCPACGASIRRIVLGQRGTWFCPRCQRL